MATVHLCRIVIIHSHWILAVENLLQTFQVEAKTNSHTW